MPPYAMTKRNFGWRADTAPQISSTAAELSPTLESVAAAFQWAAWVLWTWCMERTPLPT